MLLVMVYTLHRTICLQMCFERSGQMRAFQFGWQPISCTGCFISWKMSCHQSCVSLFDKVAVAGILERWPGRDVGGNSQQVCDV